MRVLSADWVLPVEGAPIENGAVAIEDGRIAAMLVFAILLPTVDPVSLALEFFPLLFLFEFSIWLASFMEKRWELVDEPSRWAVE